MSDTSVPIEMSCNSNGNVSPVKSPPPVMARTSLSRVRSPVSSFTSSSSVTAASTTAGSSSSTLLSSKLSLDERFSHLVKLLSSGPTLIQGKSINSEVLFDVLIAVYFECQRYQNMILDAVSRFFYAASGD